MNYSFPLGVHHNICKKQIKRPVSEIFPWYFRQYCRLLALLAFAETEIVIMTVGALEENSQCTVLWDPCALVMPLKVTLVAVRGRELITRNSG